ncbi:MAG: hypothetical protein COT00_04005 [Candidatus Omnitrophica bacterium CG07_land_8_20_14_0_80_50_8]|nr:MAG: hypothetical protein AUJ71_00245 [Candidatus Omnitrophica bacterium CG1_02_49_16]PIU39999.1 MAG: hypothetical protein COT00_04005 [Candidatus Omnitrophica bacterium CG07_land_8_20_14_0_80_50_8]
MIETIESDSFMLPQDVKKHVAGRLKESGAIHSLELELKGDAMEGAKKFGDSLVALRKKGVKISHEFLIRLDFPRKISRTEALNIVEGMPRPRNGSVRVRVHFVDETRSAS